MGTKLFSYVKIMGVFGGMRSERELKKFKGGISEIITIIVNNCLI